MTTTLPIRVPHATGHRQGHRIIVQPNQARAVAIRHSLRAWHVGILRTRVRRTAEGLE